MPSPIQRYRDGIEILIQRRACPLAIVWIVAKINCQKYFCTQCPLALSVTPSPIKSRTLPLFLRQNWSFANMSIMNCWSIIWKNVAEWYHLSEVSKLYFWDGIQMKFGFRCLAEYEYESYSLFPTDQIQKTFRFLSRPNTHANNIVLPVFDWYEDEW